jgi:hypothetical protein
MNAYNHDDYKYDYSNDDNYNYSDDDSDIEQDTSYIRTF